MRPAGAVDSLLAFVGRSNWSMLPERRVAHLIEQPEVDPTRPFTVNLHDTGEIHSGQFGWKAPTAPVVQLHEKRQRSEAPARFPSNTG